MTIGSLFFIAVDVAGVELGTLELVVVILVAIGALALGISSLWVLLPRVGPMRP